MDDNKHAAASSTTPCESPEGPTINDLTRALCNGTASSGDIDDLLRACEDMRHLDYMAIWD